MDYSAWDSIHIQALEKNLCNQELLKGYNILKECLCYNSKSIPALFQEFVSKAICLKSR